MIVITEFMDEEAIRSGLDGFEVLYDPSLVDRPDDLAVVVGQADALIVRNRTQVRGALLDAARNLKAVGRLGVGLDNIDMAACAARGIAVYPASGANDTSVAEYVITTAMLLLRGAYGATSEVAGGAWPRNRLVGREIAGKRLGLVGFGSIARETARRAAALGMTICAYDPHLPPSAEAWTQPWGRVEAQPLNSLLTEADVISLHVPLTDETRGMVDGTAIARMKKDAVVINAARGGVVDENALAAALRAGHLGGAALDVFEDEPLDADRGSIFAGIPNLILTPHIAGVTVESNVRVSWVTVDNIRRHLTGA
ncbi:hydroxyacid dehydrogenase [Chelatococcus asaccharovorans]|uniref:(S)-sulfolactate dehydrogenase n=1 Tax=Chelatococcus asaccharovorans TaxID=28210 RepID=A0A2V3UDE3_9HYPH|nr:hydroxyacid dehydrogenase [Chelatococcus asaccharovorans]MBS7707113.1 hydroxyacid dehydrogenase [Chelatococcus asaccharovorans]PXW63293.1 (S)-sulfolactate dehydrogenase [Chelatococcus asaccharovorans]